MSCPSGPQKIIEGTIKLHKYISQHIEPPIRGPPIRSSAMYYIKRVFQVETIVEESLVYIAVAALHLASKYLDDPRSLPRFVNVLENARNNAELVAEVPALATFSSMDKQQFKKTATKHIIQSENFLIYKLDFNFKAPSPYDRAKTLSSIILRWHIPFYDNSFSPVSREVGELSWVFLNQLLTSPLFYMYPADVVALVAVRLAFELLQFPLITPYKVNISSVLLPEYDSDLIEEAYQKIRNFFEVQGVMSNQYALKTAFDERLMRRWFNTPLEAPLLIEDMCPPPPLEIMETIAGPRDAFNEMWTDHKPSVLPPDIDLLMDTIGLEIVNSKKESVRHLQDSVSITTLPEYGEEEVTITGYTPVASPYGDCVPSSASESPFEFCSFTTFSQRGTPVPSPDLGHSKPEIVIEDPKFETKIKSDKNHENNNAGSKKKKTRRGGRRMRERKMKKQLKELMEAADPPVDPFESLGFNYNTNNQPLPQPLQQPLQQPIQQQYPQQYQQAQFAPPPQNQQQFNSNIPIQQFQTQQLPMMLPQNNVSQQQMLPPPGMHPQQMITQQIGQSQQNQQLNAQQQQNVMPQMMPQPQMLSQQQQQQQIMSQQQQVLNPQQQMLQPPPQPQQQMLPPPQNNLNGQQMLQPPNQLTYNGQVPPGPPPQTMKLNEAPMPIPMERLLLLKKYLQEHNPNQEEPKPTPNQEKGGESPPKLDQQQSISTTIPPPQFQMPQPISNQIPFQQPPMAQNSYPQYTPYQYGLLPQGQPQFPFQNQNSQSVSPPNEPKQGQFFNPIFQNAPVRPGLNKMQGHKGDMLKNPKPKNKQRKFDNQRFQPHPNERPKKGQNQGKKWDDTNTQWHPNKKHDFPFDREKSRWNPPNKAQKVHSGYDNDRPQANRFP